MLDFQPISLQDRDKYYNRIRPYQIRGSESSFGGVFIWAGFYHSTMAFHEDRVFIRIMSREKPMYVMPFASSDLKEDVELLKKDAASFGAPLKMISVTQQVKEAMDRVFPGNCLELNRDYADYVYKVSELTMLQGKKYHAKRNHISYFEKNCDWSYEELNEENIAACMELNVRWEKDRAVTESIHAEKEALQRSFAYFGALGFVGGVIRVDGRVEAYTIAEPLPGDTIVIHIEKANSEIRGLYPMINREFLVQHAANFTYVNREEDMGLLNLRKAKLSYHPDFLLEKYTGNVFCEGDTE